MASQRRLGDELARDLQALAIAAGMDDKPCGPASWRHKRADPDPPPVTTVTAVNTLRSVRWFAVTLSRAHFRGHLWGAVGDNQNRRNACVVLLARAFAAV